MMNKEEAVLQVRDLLLRYGPALHTPPPPPPPPAAGKEPLSPLRYCLGCTQCIL